MMDQENKFPECGLAYKVDYALQGLVMVTGIFCSDLDKLYVTLEVVHYCLIVLDGPLLAGEI